MLAEGGAVLNGALIRQNLADEFFLTLASRITGGATAHPAVQWPGETAKSEMRELSLLHMLPAETGEVFLRYRIG